MKIIAIVGSPKGKGAGYKIVKMIEDRMKAIGEIEFTYLFLKEANLKPCLGCYQCMAKGKEICPRKDDRAAIEQDLLAADGVILSSPLHVLNVSSLMSNFIDRFAYANHRPRFHRLKVMTVVNMGGDSSKAALSFLRNSLGGSRIVHEVGVATPPWMQTERAVAKKERTLDAAAGRFYRACLDTSLPSPTLRSLILFLVRQKISIECRKTLPADDAYYQGKAYYFETRVNPVKAALSKAIVRVMMKIKRDMRPGNVAWPSRRRGNNA